MNFNWRKTTIRPFSAVPVQMYGMKIKMPAEGAQFKQVLAP